MMTLSEIVETHNIVKTGNSAEADGKVLNPDSYVSMNMWGFPTEDETSKPAFLQVLKDGFVKFFDPYIYREPINFASEEEATKYYLAKLREQIIYEGPDQVAAIVMETITGSNGIIIPPKGYLPGVRKICDEFGIVMICDEVMAGWGRTGKMFAFENFDVKPDLVTFAKGVTCGYVQLGGVAVSSKIASYFDDHFLSCGLTYSGHPLACAAGVACVNYYQKANILDNVNKVGKVLAEKLDAYKEAHACVGDVRHIGLFSCVELGLSFWRGLVTRAFSC
jgi:taurine--2-oxoglutarate transaminase